MGLAAPILISWLVCVAPSGCSAPDASTPRLHNQDAEGLKDIGTPFTFVVMGDNRSGAREYGAMAERIAAMAPAFVVNTGDVVDEPGDRDDWDEFVKLSAPLTMPYFITPGNHDVDDDKSEAAFRELVEQPGNELYYSFEAGGSLFVVLDSEIPGHVSRIDGAQLEWLRGVLAGSGARFKFVFVHRPLYPDPETGRHYGDSLNAYAQERDALQKLFEDTGVSAVFAGHEHMYARKMSGGVTHVITGGAGAPLYASGGEGGYNHFIRVTVDDGSASAGVFDLGGNVRDEFEITGNNTE